MQDVIAPEERLTRFIFSSGHFSRESNRVKHNAFLPTSERETSVSRTAALPEDQIWIIGSQIAPDRGQTLHARGDIFAAQVRKARLEVQPAEPPPRHAIIIHWSQEKSAQKLQAMELAESARLVLPPSFTGS
jgi:hypothetical protein